jgi:DNA polymerase-3 subunit epsilon
MREIVLDTETTGLDPAEGHKVIEIGCVELINKVKTGSVFHCYINPCRNVPKEAYQIHGISEEFLKDKKIFREIADEFVEYIQDSTLIIHNAKFDLKFINAELVSIGKINLAKMPVIDTLDLARKKFPGSPASLDALCKRYKVDLARRDKHGALLDAELLAEVYLNLCGGKQTKLEFSENKQEIALGSEKLPKQFKEPRKFEIGEEELIQHHQLLKKLKNPLWVA